MIIKNAFFITSAATENQFIKSNKPMIAVCGKSNVGKSSFINMLAGQNKLARTSNTPGRTRLINYFDFGKFILADLPGYGYAEVCKEEKEKWGRTLDAFFADRKNINYVFSLVDIRHDPSADDETMINFLHHYTFPFSLIATKADKIKKNQVAERLKSITSYLMLTEYNILPISSETGFGKDKVLSKIEEILKTDEIVSIPDVTEEETEE